MNREVKICFAYKTTQTEELRKCREIFSDIFVSLIEQGKSEHKKEFSKLSDKICNADDIFTADFIAGDPSHGDFQVQANRKNEFPSRPVPAFIILTNDDWGEDVNSVLRNPVYDVHGIFRLSKLAGVNRDPEDFGNFTASVKNLLRRVLRSSGLHEEDFVKPINWKVKIKSDYAAEFMSLFSTPSMQKMARKYKDALLDLNDETLRALRCFRAEDTLPRRCNAIRNFFAKRKIFTNTYRVPSLLILGETGCGKSLLASSAASFLMGEIPLTKINISSYNPEAIDTLLFGAEKGSYTDSDRDRLGLFIGHCGEAVFLDEIGDMDLESQTRLLTYMDNGQVLPRGMTEAICAPCILIAATNKDVKDDKTFRQDILNRFEHVIEIPALRERKQDLRLLISMTLQNEKVNPGRVKTISLDAINYLEDQKFHGNFRELRFILTQAVNNAFSEGSECLCLRHLI